jgi:hypothetical protein
LTVWSRTGASREAVDDACRGLEIHELPSARGCTYVVPRSHFALALRVAQAFGGADRALALKLGVPTKELDTLAGKVVDALASASSPLDPEAIRAAVGGAVRSLGPEGVKKGLASTLPVVLGELQTAGEIRRVPVNGRLDQQRYAYRVWRPNPLAGFRLTAAECATELARLYFGWIGPATLKEFQWFSGWSAKVAKAALEPLKLAPFDSESGRLILPAQVDEFAAFRVPREPHYRAVSSLDGLALLRRDLHSLLAPGDLDQVVVDGKGARPLGGLSDLPSHAIVDRGRVIGLWEYDPETSQLAWRLFSGKPDHDLRALMVRCAEFIRDQLGDARSFSLDSPKSRRPRIDSLLLQG